MRTQFAMFLAVTGLSLGACSGGQRVAGWQETLAAPHTLTVADVSARDALLNRALSAWALRDQEGQLRETIAALRQVVAIEPGNAEYWTWLSRAYYFLGDAHLSFNPVAQTEMLAVFDLGARAAEHALVAASPVFAERAHAGAIVEEQLPLFDTSAVAPLYWRAINLHRWSSAQSSSVVRRVSPDVRSSMTRVLELDPAYDAGGAYRYFGEYYGRARPSAGGDLARAKANFEASIRLQPASFAARVQLAEIYATQTRNRALFDEQINFVLMSAATGESCGECEGCCPDLGPENAAEQKRARKLLEQAGILFR